MPIPRSASPATGSGLANARLHARMERVSPGLAGRPPRLPRGDGDEAESKGAARLGWMGWLVVNLLVMVGIVAVVLIWSPLESCRAQEKTVGFYAGETLDQCVRRKINERILHADQHIKLMLRGFGH
jgi:hypothetical protein